MPAVARERRIETTVTERTLERIDRTAYECEMSRAQFVRSAVLKQLSEIEAQRQEA